MRTNVGISIGYNKIRIYTENETGRSIQQSYTTPDDTRHSEFLAFLKSTINNFLKENEIKKPSIHITLTPDDKIAVARVVSTPIIEKKAMSKAIRFEITDAGIVENIDEYHVKWSKIRESSADSQMKTFVVAVRKDLLAAIASIRKASWRMESIVVTPSIIGEYVKNHSVVVDYGYNETLLYFMADGKVDDIISIPSGEARIRTLMTETLPDATSNDLDDILSQTFFYGLDEGLETKGFISKKIHDDDEILVADISDLSCFNNEIDKDVLMEISFKISGETKYLTNEIKRLVRQFELTHNTNVSTIFHIGDPRVMHSFIDYMDAAIDNDVAPFSTLLQKGERALEDEPYTTAVAAITTKKSKNSMDFSKFAKNNTDINSILVATIVTFTLLNAGSFYMHRTYTERLAESKSALSTQSRTRSDLERQVREYHEEISKTRETLTIVDKLGEERKNLSEFLYHLPEIIPNDVSIYKIMVHDDMVALRGYAKDYSNLGLFAIELEKLGTITIDYIDRESQSDLPVSSVLITGETTSVGASNEFAIRVKLNTQPPVE